MPEIMKVQNWDVSHYLVTSITGLLERASAIDA